MKNGRNAEWWIVLVLGNLTPRDGTANARMYEYVGGATASPPSRAQGTANIARNAKTIMGDEGSGLSVSDEAKRVLRP